MKIIKAKADGIRTLKALPMRTTEAVAALATFGLRLEVMNHTQRIGAPDYTIQGADRRLGLAYTALELHNPWIIVDGRSQPSTLDDALNVAVGGSLHVEGAILTGPYAHQGIMLVIPTAEAAGWCSHCNRPSLSAGDGKSCIRCFDKTDRSHRWVETWTPEHGDCYQCANCNTISRVDQIPAPGEPGFICPESGADKVDVSSYAHY